MTQERYAGTGAHPEGPWPQIRGFRNILVHQYLGVDVGVVHDVVETHLPPLAEAVPAARLAMAAAPYHRCSLFLA